MTFPEMDAKRLISMILHIFISFKICRGLSYLFMIFNQNMDKERLYIYSFNLKNDLRATFYHWQFFAFIMWPVFTVVLSESFLKEIFVAVLIFSCTAIHHFTTYPDENHILEDNNLHIGYGAALAYYKNYIEKTLTERFSERVDNFNSYNKIEIPKKLFILVPLSCKVQHYLDSSALEKIERCQELPNEELSHAGIKNRKYNITIYNINGLRMAVEFAQPLKGLYLFKEKGLLTQNEMLYQRNLFIKILKNFQKEDHFKYFEVVDYDDSASMIYEVLTNSYYGSHSEIV